MMASSQFVHQISFPIWKDVVIVNAPSFYMKVKTQPNNAACLVRDKEWKDFNEDYQCDPHWH
jgi:hypothetical protein